MTILFVFCMIFFIGVFTYLVYQNNLLDKEHAALNKEFRNLLDDINADLAKMTTDD